MSIGKTKMKRILFLLSIFIIVSCSNRQSTNPSSNMQLSRIIAQESTECLCCPGFYIEIENDTIKLKNNFLNVVIHFIRI